MPLNATLLQDHCKIVSCNVNILNGYLYTNKNKNIIIAFRLDLIGYYKNCFAAFFTAKLGQ